MIATMSLRPFLFTLLACVVLFPPVLKSADEPAAKPVRIVLVGDSTVATGGGWGDARENLAWGDA